MTQLSSVVQWIDLEILSSARKQLGRRSREETLLNELQGERGRLLCPFCMYQSEGNRTSAVIKNGFFKCFQCGKSGRCRNERGTRGWV